MSRDSKSNFWADIEFAANGEPIEVVYIGHFGDQYWMSDATEDQDPRDVGMGKYRGRPINPKLAGKLLDYEYYTGYGGADCHAVHVFTPTRLLLVSEYDGATGIISVPRNPPHPMEPHYRPRMV